MARPLKNGIDYFPLNTVLDTKFKLIEAEFGLTGFAVVVKLFQKIYGERGYYCEWTNEVALLFSHECGGGNAVSEIVSAAIKRGIFDKDMYDKYSILTSTGIQERYFEAVSRRVQIDVKTEYLLVSDTFLSENVNRNRVNVNRNSKNADNNTQIKENKIKENKSILNNNKKIGEVVGIYEKNIGSISPIVAEKISYYLAEVDESLIVYAIEQAVFQNKKKWSYINAILNNCLKEGIKTRADIENRSPKRSSSAEGYTLDDMAAEERKRRLERSRRNENQGNTV